MQSSLLASRLAVNKKPQKQKRLKLPHLLLRLLLLHRLLPLLPLRLLMLPKTLLLLPPLRQPLLLLLLLQLPPSRLMHRRSNSAVSRFNKNASRKTGVFFAFADFGSRH